MNNLKKIIIPKSYINSLQTDKEFQIYNTKEEQELYVNKWLELSY